VRVRDLPRRAARFDDQDLIADLTAWLRLPHPTCTDPDCKYWQPLRGVQAASLAEAWQVRGLVGPQRVGAGKTLEDYALPIVLEARRPMILTFSNLIYPLEVEFAHFARHYRAPDPWPYIEAYETLSRDYGDVDGLTLLDRYLPDLLICDEAQRLAPHDSATSRKVRRFMASHPETMFVALSGTLMNRSLREYAHLLAWALKDGAPVPRDKHALEDWANALDAKVSELAEVDPGMLLTLALPEDRDPDPRVTARRGYGRRLAETPGIVMYGEQYAGASLLIREKEFATSGPIEHAFSVLRDRWELPDETTLADGMAITAVAQEYVQGFYYVWSPAAPESWKAPRAAWHKVCREIIRTNKRGIDSEGQVADYATSGRAPKNERWEEAARRYAEWERVRPTFVPNPIAVWLDEGPVHEAAEWLRKHKRGIAWVEHTAFGAKLAKLAKTKYYGEGGMAPDGEYIESSRGRGIVASIRANSVGRNLQVHYSDNLICVPPSTGKGWEQLLGREHREGQTEDQVTADCVTGCYENVNAWLQAREDAACTADIMNPMKIMLCDLDMPSYSDLERRSKRQGEYRYKRD
jgi:hypothetical protein